MANDTVEIACKHGHTHVYSGPRGRSVKCKTCRASLWLRKDASAPSAGIPSGLPTLVELWSHESPVERMLGSLDRSPYSCGECGGETFWEGRRTMVYCHPCHRIDVPQFVIERYEQNHAGDAPATRELAVRGPSAAEVRADTARLSGHRETMLDGLQKAFDSLDVGGLGDSQTRREAVQWRGWLRDYIGHVRGAETVDELTEIKDEILEQAPSIRQVEDSIADERNRLEVRRQAEAEGARQAELQKAEWERQQRAEAARHHENDVPPGTMVPASSSSQSQYSPQAVAVAQTIAYFQERRERKKEIGRCVFRHRIRPIAVCRMFPVYAQFNSTQVAGSPEVRVCAKHQDAAMTWFGERGYQWIETESLSQWAH